VEEKRKSYILFLPVLDLESSGKIYQQIQCVFRVYFLDYKQILVHSFGGGDKGREREREKEIDRQT
jgi:hypothetical protein